MTPDRSNPIMKMSAITADMWLKGSTITNDFRSLKEWAKLLQFTPPEVRRWLNDHPRQWELKNENR